MKTGGASGAGLGDVVRLADDAVVGIALKAQSGALVPDLLDEGVELCDIMLVLFGERVDRIDPSQLDSIKLKEMSTILSKAGLQSEELLPEVKETKGIIRGLIAGSDDPPPDRLANVEAALLRWTMPFWRERLGEFRTRRERREFRARG